MIPDRIATERLVLRPPVMADAAAIAHHLNDFAVAGNLARVPYPYRLTDARAWLRTRHPHLTPGEASFAIDLPGAGLIGQVGFHQGREGTVVGYWLGQPHWGKGIMTEATIAAIDWFFAASDAERLISGVFAFNAPSLAIQRRLGFAETGRSRLVCLARGREVEHIDTELTRRTWEKRTR